QAAKFSKAENRALLTCLLENKATQQSGNGWKPPVWPLVVAAVNLVRDQSISECTTTQCQNRNSYLKTTFEAYCLVAGYSGTGWDDELKHCVATDNFQATFFAMYDQTKYQKCFTTPCPYYEELDKVYDGAKNKATGENVVTGRRLKRKSNRDGDKENGEQKKKKRKGRRERAQSEEPVDDKEEGTSGGVNNDAGPTAAEKGKGNTSVEKDVFGDMIPSSPLKPSTQTPTPAPQPKSKPNSGGGVKRNSDAANNVAKSLESLGKAMGEPIRLQEDSSHSDAVIKILDDNEDLLPYDPDGMLYVIVTEHYANNVQAANVFVKTNNANRRSAMIRVILDKAKADGRID
ncbi:hypothetical protein C8F01DRAFT_1161467, partial [Mycena amicta]